MTAERPQPEPNPSRRDVPGRDPGTRNSVGRDPAERARLATEELAQARADARARGHAARAGDGLVRRMGRAERGLPAWGKPAGGEQPWGKAEPGQLGPGQLQPGQLQPGGPERGQPERGGPAPRKPRGPGASPPGPGGTAARQRRDDPQALRAAIDGLLGDQGWRGAAAVGSVFGRWHEIVGPEVAAHTRPERYDDGEVVVLADSPVWAAEMRLQAATLVRRLNEELGDGTVSRVTVRGPAGPRPAGTWRVRSGRRPRPSQR